MRSPLRLVNLLLGVVATLIVLVLAKTWVSPMNPLPRSATALTSQDTEVLPYNPTTRPPINQFDVLLERNPFRQPPPMPTTPARSAPPEPLPALVGTILVGNDRRAVLSNKGKSDIYAIGQTVAGGVVTEIKEDKIVLKRGDEAIPIMLKAAIKSTPLAAEGTSSAEPPPTPVVAPVPPPAPAAFNPFPEGRDSEREQRRQERRRMREEQRLQRE